MRKLWSWALSCAASAAQREPVVVDAAPAPAKTPARFVCEQSACAAWSWGEIYGYWIDEAIAHLPPAAPPLSATSRATLLAAVRRVAARELAAAEVPSAIDRDVDGWSDCADLVLLVALGEVGASGDEVAAVAQRFATYPRAKVAHLTALGATGDPQHAPALLACTRAADRDVAEREAAWLGLARLSRAGLRVTDAEPWLQALETLPRTFAVGEDSGMGDVWVAGLIALRELRFHVDADALDAQLDRVCGWLWAIHDDAALPMAVRAQVAPCVAGLVAQRCPGPTAPLGRREGLPPGAAPQVRRLLAALAHGVAPATWPLGVSAVLALDALCVGSADPWVEHALLEQLSATEPQLRGVARSVLARLGGRPGHVALQRDLAYADESDARWTGLGLALYARACRQAGNAAAADAIALALQVAVPRFTSGWRHEAAALVLGVAQAEVVRDALAEVVSRPRATSDQQMAAQALRLFGDAALLPILQRLDPTQLQTCDHDAVLIARAGLGDRGWRSVLDRVLADPPEEDRMDVVTQCATDCDVPDLIRCIEARPHQLRARALGWLPVLLHPLRRDPRAELCLGLNHRLLRALD